MELDTASDLVNHITISSHLFCPTFLVLFLCYLLYTPTVPLLYTMSCNCYYVVFVVYIDCANFQ